MNKKICLLGLLFFMVTSPVQEAVATSVNVVVNQQKVKALEINIKVDGDNVIFDTSPIMVKGKSLVAAREICDVLNIKLEWLPATKTLKMSNAQKKVEVVLGKNTYKVNGNTVNMPAGTTAQNISINNKSVTFVPLRLMVDAFDYRMDWDSNTNTANIKQKQPINKGDSLLVEVDTNLMMRKQPSKTGEIVKRLPDGTSIKAVSAIVEKEGITWVKVQDSSGTVGYVATDWVTVDKKADYGIDQYAVVQVDTSLNVRKESKVGAEVLGKLTNGTKVKIISSVVSSGSYDWVKIQTMDGKIKGWVAMDWLVKQDDYKPTQKPTPEESLKLQEVSIDRDSYFMPIINIIGNKKYKATTTFLDKNGNYPDRIVIDVPQMDMGVYKSKLNAEGLMVLDYKMYPIKAIKLSNAGENSRIIIELEKKIGYKIIEAEGKNGLSIVFDKDDYYIGGSENVHEEKKPDQVQSNNDFLGAKMVTYKGENALEISADKINQYNITKLEKPDRMVIDFEDMKVAPKFERINLSSDFVTQIRTSQFQSDEIVANKKAIVRVVVDLKQKAIVKTEIVGNKMYMIFKKENTTYNGMSYFKGDGYSKISFNDITKYANQVMTGLEPSTLMVKLDANYPTTSQLVSFDDGYLIDMNYQEKDGNKYAVLKLYGDVKYEANYQGKNLVMTFYREKPALRKVTVVVDAGHGGLSNQRYNGHSGDSGAISPHTGLKEKDVNLAAALKLQQELEARGYNVIMTRSTDVYITLMERANIANQANADVFISLHHNSIANPNVRGIMTLYCPTFESEIKSVDQYPLAKAIQDQLAAQLGAQDRGVIKRPELVVIRETKMPAVLVELGFLTNAREAQVVATDEYQRNAAKAIADGMEAYLNTLK